MSKSGQPATKADQGGQRPAKAKADEADKNKKANSEPAGNVKPSQAKPSK